MGSSLPGCSLHGILQARVLEWVAISFSRGSSQLRDRTWVSRNPSRRFNLWANQGSPYRCVYMYMCVYMYICTYVYMYVYVYVCVCVHFKQCIGNSATIYIEEHVLIGEGNGTPLQYSCLENPMDEEPGRLQFMGSRRIQQDWATSLSLFTFMHWRRKWQPTPVFLPGES